MRARTNAFTVIEVLMALAIFALFATVIAAGYLNVLRAYQAADSDGLEEGRVRFSRIEFLNTKEREDAERGASFSDGDVRVTWSSRIDPSAVPDLFRVEFTCRQDVPGRAKPLVSAEVVWLLRPQWSQPDERGPVEERFRHEVREHLSALQGGRP